MVAQSVALGPVVHKFIQPVFQNGEIGLFIFLAQVVRPVKCDKGLFAVARLEQLFAQDENLSFAQVFDLLEIAARDLAHKGGLDAVEKGLFPEIMLRHVPCPCIGLLLEFRPDGGNHIFMHGIIIGKTEAVRKRHCQ